MQVGEKRFQVGNAYKHQISLSQTRTYVAIRFKFVQYFAHI